MGRPSTVTGAWSALVEAYGGVGPLAEEIGVSRATLFRLAREQIPAGLEIRKRVFELATAKKLPPPLDPPRQHKVDAIDMELLDQLGRCIQQRAKVPDEFTRRLASRLGDATLIELAESDRVTANVHLAVSKLLGL